MEILRTGRLVLSEFKTSDATFILELVNSPGWLEFIGDRNIKTREAAISYLENGPMKSYQEHGYGLYKISLKKDHSPIGMCGLVNRPTLADIDIGFALMPEYFGKGFAFEAAKATMDYADSKLGIKRIAAITDKRNVRSQKLLEKIGLQFEKIIEYGEKKEELMFYGHS